MEIADALVAELAIEHFFNIQLVGEHVIEINPRISTIVYQEDLNLPYLGVKRALGEISDDELAGARARGSGRAGRPALLRPGRLGRSARRLPRARAWLSGLSRHALPGQHGRRAVGERPGAAAAGRRRAARRLRPLHAPPRGGLVARRSVRAVAPPAGAAVGGARAAAAADGRLPLLLRAHARAEVAPVPDPARGPEEVGHPLPRLGHPRQDPGAARVRQAGRRADRRLLRRDPLGARGRGDPAGDRPRADRARAAVRPRPPADRPRALLAPAQGHRARDRRVRGARRRPRARRGPPPRRGAASATAPPTSSSTS